MIYNGDCLEFLPILADNSVDLVIADPPYHQTHNKWDVEIPLDPLWEVLKRIVKPNGAIILFGQGMFTAKVMMSNPKMWRYNIVWDKQMTTGFLNANRMPLRQHEDIMVFYQKLPVYNPQKTLGEPSHSRKVKDHKRNSNYGDFSYSRWDYDEYKYPTSIISMSKVHSSVAKHPTEKPIELMEYLIETYSNEGDVVLDFCMGCGSTGVAAKNLNRDFLGIEQEEEYFKIARNRLISG